jgi:hypothetical protein
VAHGWAFDPDQPKTSIQVHFYAGGEAGREGALAGYTKADSPRPDVNNHFGISGSHGFRWRIPQEFQGLKIFGYAIDTSGGRNSMLHGSPRQSIAPSPEPEPEPPTVRVISHDVVQKVNGIWMMGAANGCANQWCWGNEIVIHYGRQRFDYEFPSKHNCPDRYEPDYESPNWSRSLDGGRTWAHSNGPVHTDGPSLPIHFTHPGFGLWVPHDTRGHDEEWIFFVTYDRWGTMIGPYNGLNHLKQALTNDELTSRSDYIVNGPDDIFLFMSGRDEGQRLDDYAFLARSTDGGRSFAFVSRINPWGDPVRGVMPSVVRVDDNRLVACLRRREKKYAYTDGGYDMCWIDCYRSDNNGASWYHLSKVDETGFNNGNPPALSRLPDGLLACVYGVRAWRPATARISVKLSADDGLTWSQEVRLHDGYHVDYEQGQTDASDLGYPRLYLLPDHQLRAVYAWSDGPNENHICSTLFEVKGAP